MATYAAALYELAVANGCAFMDLQFVFGPDPAGYASPAFPAHQTLSTASGMVLMVLVRVP
jgi:hypothetical protein